MIVMMKMLQRMIEPGIGSVSTILARGEKASSRLFHAYIPRDPRSSLLTLAWPLFTISLQSDCYRFSHDGGGHQALCAYYSM